MIDIANASRVKIGELARRIGTLCRASGVLSLCISKVEFRRSARGVVNGARAWAELPNGYAIELVIGDLRDGTTVCAFRRIIGVNCWVSMRVGELSQRGAGLADMRLVERVRNGAPDVLVTAVEYMAEEGITDLHVARIERLSPIGVRRFAMLIATLKDCKDEQRTEA